MFEKILRHREKMAEIRAAKKQPLNPVTVLIISITIMIIVGILAPIAIIALPFVFVFMLIKSLRLPEKKEPKQKDNRIDLRGIFNDLKK